MNDLSPRLFLSAPSQAPASTPAPASTSTPTTDARSTTFRAVEGGNEMQSGEKLLVEAYAAMWLLIFLMLIFAWRRQKKTDERIAFLEQAVMNARSEASKSASVSAAAGRAPKTAEAGDA